MDNSSYLSIPVKTGECETSKESYKPHTNKYRNLRTFCVFLCFFALGLGSSVVGPSLVHMRHILHADIAIMSLTFTCGRIGFLIGSLTCGVLYDRFNSELQLFICTFWIGIWTIAMPWSNYLYGYFAMNAVQSVGRGFLDTAAHPYIILLWIGHRFKDPMLQGMHAVWAIGSSVGPFIVSPFLVELTESSDREHNATAGMNNRMLLYNETDSNPDYEDITRVRYSFSVIGLIILISSLSFLILYFISGPTCVSSKKSAHHAENKTNSSLTNCTLKIIVAMHFFIFFSYILYEAIPAELLTAFVIEGLGWEAYKGPWIAGIYWGSNAIGRVINTPASLFVSPPKMLFFNLTFTTLAFILMLFCNYLSGVFLWISVAMAGFSMSSTFAAIFSWNSNIMKITGTIAGIFLAGSSSGGMTGTAVAGYLFDNHSHMWVVYLSLGGAVVHVILFVFSYSLVKCCNKNTEAKRESCEITMLS